MSCKEFIEPSITKRQQVLNAPANGYLSTKYAINFWWGDVEDALYYRLQVVTPNFDSIGGLILDTLVNNTKFIATLDPGQYQWRVRAENGSSQTAYSIPRSFTVKETSLIKQTVSLAFPANNVVTNQVSINFKWNALFGATKYQVEIDTNNFVDETALLYNQVIPGQQLNYNLPKQKLYGWRVRAANETEQSEWSAVNYFTFKADPPGQVTLLAPSDNAVLSSPVNLQWSTINGATNYKLYVFKSDSVTNYNTSFPLTTPGTNYNFTLGTSGEKIYWKISSRDIYGNEGKASSLQSFIVL